LNSNRVRGVHVLSHCASCVMQAPNCCTT
jgi:hypothetical protein